MVGGNGREEYVKKIVRGVDSVRTTEGGGKWKRRRMGKVGLWTSGNESKGGRQRRGDRERKFVRAGIGREKARLDVTESALGRHRVAFVRPFKRRSRYAATFPSRSFLLLLWHRRYVPAVKIMAR